MERIDIRQFEVLARWTSVIGMVTVFYHVSAFLVLASLADDWHWLHD